jgi:hypothetical protein
MRLDDETKQRVWYSLHTALVENPQTPTQELCDLVKVVRNMKRQHKSSQALVDKAFKDQILVGPRLYCNSGTNFALYTKEMKKKVEGITLVGQYSDLVISYTGEGNLQYVDVINPSFPEYITLESGLTPDERAFFDKITPGKLQPDKRPHWDDTDWKIYYALRNPRQDFTAVSQQLQIPRETFEKRFNKILNDCKVFLGFYPLGYKAYEPFLVTFTSKYETGIREWLQQLDRTSFLFKTDDLMLVSFFHRHINRTCLKLVQLEEIGIIHSFKWAIPFMDDIFYV